MNAAILLSVLPLLASIGGGEIPPLAAIPDLARRGDDAEVRVWIDESDDLLQRGERVGVAFRAYERGYVTVVRIDTDGALHVLFPESPRDEGWVSGERSYHTYPFRVDDDHGIGYVFAIWSPDPFDYRELRDRGRWGYRLAGWRVHGDPYVAADDFARQIIDRRDSYYAIDMDEYSVGRRYAYPRFMCYDCHTARPYRAWDPYAYRCVSVRVVVYDDPYYYPYRRYPGTRVVYARPRYEFKEVGRGERVTPENFIERRRRVADVDPRRPGGGEAPGPRPGGGDTRPGDRPRPGGGDGGTGGNGGDGGGGRPGTIPPGHGGTPPGQGGTPPGRGNDPPSQGGTPPGHQGAPPGQGGTPPGRREDRREVPRAAEARPTEVRRAPERESPRYPERTRDDPPARAERPTRREEPRADPPRREEVRRSEPRPQPRNEPRPEPRPEPRSEPRNEPRPQPRNEPRPEQRPVERRP